MIDLHQTGSLLANPCFPSYLVSVDSKRTLRSLQSCLGIYCPPYPCEWINGICRYLSSECLALTFRPNSKSRRVTMMLLSEAELPLSEDRWPNTG